MMVRVLIVEDDPADMELLMYTLQAAGYDTLCAHDGDEAVDVFRREHPDLVITKTGLPRRPARDLLALVRSDAPRRAVPVIALAGERGEGNDAGFDATLPHPIVPDALIDAVERLCAVRPPRQLRRENGNHPDR
ncbi:response regulator [Noviherbaspirillum galbum]|uniref:Response regulator n=1 Tax=Noviherbaspirillum galbum TaxID=2709383 RepID=A0A6B3SVZ6_9BURK|nr:response regulator [Noviherbaspirillum galbum]NEX61809.1 response regulator [Noviherbaspirillum galbum]